MKLFFVDLENENYYLIDKSDYGLIDSFSFSWDSKYIAYSFPISFNKSIIKIFDIESKEKYNVTDGLGFDFNPYFPKMGSICYLYQVEILTLLMIIYNLK